MAPTTHRRLLLPLFLAVILAGEVAGFAAAARMVPTASPAATPLAATPSSRVHAATPVRTGEERPARTVLIGTEDATAAQRNIRHDLGRAATVRPALPAVARATTVPAAGGSSSSAYRGRNHVWIPSLGIDRSVAAFPCSRSRPPDNHIYRWGCSGRNNVYLLGHAFSVFKPLHDAFVGGRLRKGMKVHYADGNGRVTTYSVIWWKVTKPVASASWAWAPQATPSMTLQTCVGRNGSLRLMVRLVATG